MPVHLIDLRSDVLLFSYVLFYLYILTFVMLNCLIVRFFSSCFFKNVEFEWSKRQIFILCIYYE